MTKDFVSFEHFDPDIELGMIDVNGQSIRARKKPGRKPNPPSPAQRKAQNRAAQRAFRERKRYEMREAQMTAKKYLHARNQALAQVKHLKRRVEELEHETNYLKGYTLTLKLACLANRVEVPKYWDSGVTDELGCDEIIFSKTKGVPQLLEFFLDKDMNIINYDQLHQNLEQKEPEMPPSSILSPSTSFLDTPSSSEDELEIMNDLQRNHAVFESFLQQQQQHPQQKCTPRVSEFPQTTLPRISLEVEDEEDDNYDTFDEKIIDPKTGVVRSVVVIPDSFHTHTKSQEKKMFPPMPAVEAVKIIKTLKHLSEDARVIFTPTELQRHVRHDPRIDSLPGPAYRDHLILFQDYYNADEFFDYVGEHCLFLGGELGNLNSWFLPLDFFKKYWFICPTHRRERIDNTAEILVFVHRKLLECLATRKKMYIDREQYPDCFPTPTKEEQQEIDDAFLQQDDQQILNDMLHEHEEEPEEDEEMNEHEPTIQPLRLIPSHMPLSKYQQAIHLT